MSTKYTPAPWLQKHRQGSDKNYRTEIFSEVHGGIATCEWTPQNLGNGVTGTYREANAQLIAAAPESIEALQLARKELHACQAVIHLHGGFDPAYVNDAQKALKIIDAAIAKALGGTA